MKNTILFFISLAIILYSTSLLPAQGARLHVRADAPGGGNGLTWATAFSDLQTALQAALAGDEVWVAEGTYHTTTTTDRTISFEPKSGVRLFGGFAGAETDLAQRDWEAHPTVLSGDIGMPGDSTDNSYNVLYLHEPDSSTLLDGCVVRGGNADYLGLSAARDRRKNGGGLYIMGEDAEAYPSVRNCRFEQNTARSAGGGVCVNGGGDGSVAPLFFNCRFEENRSLVNGGGLAYLGAAWVERGVEIDSCTFLRNTALSRGGGLFYQDAERTDRLEVARCNFTENTGYVGGGGVQFLLGRSSGASLLLDNILFEKNNSLSAVAVDVLPMNLLSTSKVETYSCKFIENNILVGNSNVKAVLYFDLLPKDSSILLLSNNLCVSNIGQFHIISLIGNEQKHTKAIIGQSLFFNNESNSLIVSSDASIDYINCSFIKNKCQNSLLRGTRVNYLGINTLFFANEFRNNHFTDSDIVYENCTMAHNKYVNPVTIQTQKNIKIHNSVCADKSEAVYWLNSVTSTVLTHSYFDTLDCSALPANVTCGPGLIIGGDPMFVQPDSGDYRLLPCSPLLNAGNNTYVTSGADLAGNPRIRGGTVDIGAYENQGPALAAAPEVLPSCPGGASGAVQIAVQDACPPLSVAWQAGPAAGTQLDNLPAGTYQITLTDSKGQALVFEATVPQGTAPALTPLPTPVVCGDTLGGSATAAVADAPGPYGFDWGPLGTDTLLSGLPPGLYPVTITDARGCSATGNVQIERTGNLSIDIQAQAISCHSAADGSLTVLPANGKPPFAWNWANPPGGAGPTIGPLGPGSYFGTLTDAFGCNINWVAPLGQPDPLSPNPFVTDASDTAAADGSIQLLPFGGTGPYTALWSNGHAGLLLDSLPSGAYSATVTDANGCTAVTPPILVGITTGTDAPDSQTLWQVLPNPAAAVASIALSQPAEMPLRIRLWQAGGQLALETTLPAGADRLPLPVGELARGMYFVQVGAAVKKVALW